MQTPSKWKQEAAGQACLDTHYVLPLSLFLCNFELCGGLACMVPSQQILWWPGGRPNSSPLLKITAYLEYFVVTKGTH